MLKKLQGGQQYFTWSFLLNFDSVVRILRSCSKNTCEFNWVNVVQNSKLHYYICPDVVCSKKLLKSTQFSFHIARTNSYLFFIDFEVIKSILEIFISNTSLLNKFLFWLSFKGSWLILFKCSLISFGLSFNTCISICIGPRQIEFLERIGVQFKEHSSSSHAVFSTEEGISLKKNFDLFCPADFYFLLNA